MIKHNTMANMQKLRETIKTVVIAVLLSAIVAFVAGVRYSESQAKDVQAQVQTATQSK